MFRCSPLAPRYEKEQLQSRNVYCARLQTTRRKYCPHTSQNPSLYDTGDLSKAVIVFRKHGDQIACHVTDIFTGI